MAYSERINMTRIEAVESAVEQLLLSSGDLQAISKAVVELVLANFRPDLIDD